MSGALGPLAPLVGPLLVAVGVGLVLAGLAHAWLPRTLGWSAQTHREAGPLTALVVRMHVYFLGLFLVAFGVLAVVVATTPPSTTGRVFCALAAVVFALRAVAEVRFVGRAVAAAGPPALASLHRAALLIWPLLVVVFALGAATRL